MGKRAGVARVCIMFNYKKNIYSLKIFKIMSICCAFFFFLFFFSQFAFYPGDRDEGQSVLL